MAMKLRLPGWPDMNKDSTPLQQLHEDFLLTKRSAGCSKNTIDWYRSNLTLYRRWLADSGAEPVLRTFTADSVRRFIVHLQERRVKFERNHLRRIVKEPLSTHTIFGYVATLKVFAVWLAAEGYTAENVLRDVPQPRKRKTVIAALNQDEIRKLLAQVPKHTAIGTRDRAILITLLDTGLRASELCDLQVRDVRLDDGYLKVLGKGDKERIVPIGANATRAVLRYQEFFRPEPARPSVENMFLSVHAEPLTPLALREMVTRWGKKAGLKINVHKLRHSFALQYLLAGGDAFSLQKILGHTTMEMTRNYVNMLSEHLVEQHRLYSPMDRLRASAPPASRQDSRRDAYGRYASLNKRRLPGRKQEAQGR